LQELIDRQVKALADNKDIQARLKEPNAVEQQQEIALGMEDLTKDQAGIQTDSEAVSKQVLETINQHEQSVQPPGSGVANQAPVDPQQLAQMREKLGKVKGHIDNSIGQQAVANERLKMRQLAPAQPKQEVSEQELRKALEALQDENQQQQQQRQEEGEETEQGDEKEEQQEQQQGNEGDNGEKEEERQEEMQAAKAEDILNEEKEQRDERRRQVPVRFRAVDKNW